MKALRNAKREFELNLAKEAKTNPKAFYKYCNARNGNKKHIIRLKDHNDKILTSNKDNANLLNDYFCSVFTNEDDAKELRFNSAASDLP